MLLDKFGQDSICYNTGIGTKNFKDFWGVDEIRTVCVELKDLSKEGHQPGLREKDRVLARLLLSIGSHESSTRTFSCK